MTNASSIVLERKPVELTSLIKSLEVSLYGKVQPGVVINCVPGATEYRVLTDPLRLGQVLVNMLTNACRYTLRGAITYGYEIYDDEIYFSVKDTGVGLSGDTKSMLDDLLTNKSNSARGLAISSDIIEKLGGTAGFESRGEGKGSTFWFTIPNIPAEDLPATTEASETAATAADTPAPSGDGRLTILLAEDNESNALLFNSILESKFNMVRARDGLEAVALHKQVNPDLILMDINMPGLDGYGAVREIRKVDTTVPIIAVTAYAFVSDRRRILENGFNSYVSKPINIMRLEKEINTCLGGDSFSS